LNFALQLINDLKKKGVNFDITGLYLSIHDNIPGTKISATKNNGLPIYISKDGQIKIDNNYRFEKGEKTSIIEYLKSFGYENIKFISI